MLFPTDNCVSARSQAFRCAASAHDILGIRQEATAKQMSSMGARPPGGRRPASGGVAPVDDHRPTMAGGTRLARDGTPVADAQLSVRKSSSPSPNRDSR